VRYDSILFAAAVLLTLFLAGGAGRKAEAVGDAANPAERRRALSREKRERIGRRATTAAACAVIAILFTGFLSQAQVPARAVGAPVAVTGGAARIPATGLADGHAHYFSAQAGEREIRFFVMKRPDGQLSACLDACEICGDLGYYEESGAMTCRNCTAPINPASLGRTGGCNPIPLAAAIEDSVLVIPEASLIAGARHFPRSH
jgi:uncharacterized membrane protein